MKRLLPIILLAIVAVGIQFLRAGRPVSADASARLYVVSQGEGARAVAEGLAEAGLIRSPQFFLYTVWRRGDQAKFKAGAFELSAAMSTSDIERTLTDGNPVSDETQFTALEGWTLEDLADHLESEGLAKKDDFHAQAGESAKLSLSLPEAVVSHPVLKDKPADASLEGYLFPDTYRVYADGGAAPIVRRMLDNLDRRLTPEVRAEIAASGRSLHEILTMASIIEMEVRGEEDRAIVSGIFWKRVDADRGLEADSTVNYITGHSKPSVSYAETRIDHPWNTYKYRGLPPGPIGNPGMSAILAALRPKESPYWYFLTDPEGRVHYGRTLEEHNANRAHLR